MSAMDPTPGDGPDLDDVIVGYWDSSAYVLQNGFGELLLASDTVVEVER